MKQLYIVFQKIMPGHLLLAKVLPFKAGMLSRIITFASIAALMFLALTQETFAQELPVTDDLVFHLDASDVVVDEYDNVSQWTDLSGNDYHAIQNTTANQPTFKTNVLNGKPVVRFDGDNDYLITDAFSSALIQPNTVFVVWKTNSTGTQFVIDGIDKDHRHGIYQGTGGGENVAFNAGSIQSYNKGTPFAEAIITTALFYGANSEIWENGESKLTGDVGSHSLTGVTIGARQGHGIFFLDGDIAEIIIYDRALSLSERTDVEYYLSRKYGLSMSNAPVTDGLILHLDAGALGFNDNEAVDRWDDLSGLNNDAAQTISANQPTFKTDVLNGKPVVEFDGTDDYLITDAFSSELGQPNTVFVVWKTNTTGTQFVIDGIDNDHRHGIYQGTAGGGENVAFNAGSIQSYTKDTPFAEAIITTALFNGANSEIWENGESKLTGDLGSHSLTGVTIGARQGSKDFFLNGDIAEIIIYDRALSFNERTDVEYYLSRKYGFSMSDAPVTDGLVLHLDAGALDFNDNEAVDRWDDLSGLNNDAAQTISANQPTFKTNVLNGKPVVEFDGKKKNYLITDAFSSALDQPNTVFVVWKTNTTGTQFVIDGIAPGSRHSIFQGTGGGKNVAFNAGSIQSYTKDTPFAEAIITTALFDGANSEIWENGESKLTGDVGSNSLTGVTIGARQGHSFFFLDGNVSEIIIYDRALTVNERVQVESYLTEKYGFPFKWTGIESIDWDIEGNWSPEGIPGTDANVLIPAGLINYPVLNTKRTVKSVTVEFESETITELTIDSEGDLSVTDAISLRGDIINSGTLNIPNNAFLTVRPGASLTSDGTLTVEINGEFIIESDENNGSGSVIVNNSGVNATVQRWIKGAQWHIISSPVSGQEIQDFISKSDISQNSGGAYAMTHYDESRYGGSGGWAPYYTESTEDPLVQGRGYLAGRSSDGELLFSGVLAHSDVDIEIFREAYGWNAVGNPFASALGVRNGAGSTNNFLDLNKNELDPSYAALYIYDPVSNSYKVINGVVEDIGEINQDYIQPGQGFIVKSKNDEGGGTISFTTGMRIHEKEDDSPFYKKSAASPWPLVQLQVSSNDREVTTLIAFNSNMTRGLDPTYDAGQFGADPGFNLYTRLVEDDKGIKFAIQALPDYGFEDMVIPLGFDFIEGGEVTFSAAELRLPTGASAILEDREQDVFTDLEKENYTVSLDADTEGPGRFFLHTDIQITSVEDIIDETGREKMQIYSYGKEVFIVGEVPDNSVATLYDLTGRQVKTQNLMGSERNSFRVDELDRGVYLIRVSGVGINKTVRVFIE